MAKQKPVVPPKLTVVDIENEGIAQAKMWLDQEPKVGDQAIQRAVAVLISTFVRTSEMRGSPVDTEELASMPTV